jgi:hypothetical protein
MNIKTLAILGLSAISVISFSGCATGDGSNAGKIGPDYDDPMTKQIRMQEAQSRVTRSFIR